MTKTLKIAAAALTLTAAPAFAQEMATDMGVDTNVMAATDGAMGSMVDSDMLLLAGNSVFLDSRMDVDAGRTIAIGDVRADNNAVVEIYNYQAGTQRELLGTSQVFAGVNQDVRIGLDAEPQYDVLAVLVVNGQAVASQEFEIENM